ncbi:penicillin-binding protein [Spirochaetia bacterium]|nr:penicillin-binding protein [Spirochaetia bacterium]
MFAVLIAICIGVGLGLSLAETVNIKNQENFVEFAPALPTKILDINGNLITEFSADEKREMVSLSELPRHLIHAVLAREDPNFYNHKGFSIRGIGRAVFGKLTGRDLGGGSTITQQVAGTLYTDRTEYSYTRKLRELWWAIQMERRYTKNEILEIYLNYMYMGPGVYGVEAASKYFFGHGVNGITLAESALLVIQLSSPSRLNPLAHPNDAMDRQRHVLNRMIEFGYTTPEEAEASFNEYWDNYDYTREATAAYYNREDAAPWFSEYVRRELDGMMYGAMDYYRDGYTVQTTLDLDYQRAAAKYMEQGLIRANREYARSQATRLVQAERTWLPIVNLLSLHFDLGLIYASSAAQIEQRALSRYTKVVNPVADMAALIFGLQDLKVMTNAAYGDLKTATEKNVVEGALITLENDTGYIKAIIGGSKYDESNQLIRATQGRVMPGSSFKPLYYSAAIDTRRFTPSTLIYDLPMVFHNEDGTPYIPLNFRGEWKGSVLLYDALAQSMNVPSLKVLDAIGFDAAIDRAALLLGINDPNVKRRTFPRVYPMGLGIISVAPVQMARAFAVFANQGRDVTPIAIRSVEDRNGRVVLDTERELRLRQRRMGNAAQVISPQNAYVMTGLLKKTVEMGTLYSGSGYGAKFTFRDEAGNRYRMPAAGKTGTTQNWSDAWTVGYTPYYTTAIWFGFDKPGNSLGLTLTGATLAGPVWGDFMREIHTGLPLKDFVRPAGGLVDVSVCAQSGLLPTSACPSNVILTFLSGTQPSSRCDLHGAGMADGGPGNLRSDIWGLDDQAVVGGLRMPTLQLDLLPADPSPRNNQRNTRTVQDTSPQGATAQDTAAQDPFATGAESEPALNFRNVPGPEAEDPLTGIQPSEQDSPPGYGLELPTYNPLLD